MAELLACITAIGQDTNIAVVILRGNGTVFSSGHDLGEMRDQDVPFYRKLFALCTQLMEGIHAIPQPVIAQVHGIATAAGCQLVASCDLAVAADDARFATPGVRIGLFCSTPLVALSRTIPPKKALEMLLTGDYISADEALQMGLVNRVVPASDLEAATMQLAERISASSRFVIGLGKQTFYRQQGMSRSQAYAYAQEVMTLNATCADAQEGIEAFLGKRPPVWTNK
jgi:enoyl-CoA hydratase/carnithine racemase